jgi:hypothetical protein
VVSEEEAGGVSRLVWMDLLPMVSTRPVNMVRCEEREAAGRWNGMGSTGDSVSEG